MMVMAAEARAMVDRMAFDFGQDRGRDREAEQRDREAEQREREREQRDRERERESQWYSEGQNAADEYKWDRALSYFDRVVGLKASKADAALYWKAYSQNRLGQRSEALHPRGGVLERGAARVDRGRIEQRLRERRGVGVAARDFSDDLLRAVVERQ